ERLAVDAALDQVAGPVAEQPFGDRRADERDQDQQDDVYPAPDGDLVPEEPIPDLLPVPLGANGLELAELGPHLDCDRSGEPRSGVEDLWVGLLHAQGEVPSITASVGLRYSLRLVSANIC